MFWSDEQEFAGREYSKWFALLVEHYLERVIGDKSIYIGTINYGDIFSVVWSKC